MKAPMSPEIAQVLQNPRAARELMDAVLKSRITPGQPYITVQVNGRVMRYKPVTAIHRSKTA